MALRFGSPPSGITPSGTRQWNIHELPAIPTLHYRHSLDRLTVYAGEVFQSDLNAAFRGKQKQLQIVSSLRGVC